MKKDNISKQLILISYIGVPPSKTTEENLVKTLSRVAGKTTVVVSHIEENELWPFSERVEMETVVKKVDDVLLILAEDFNFLTSCYGINIGDMSVIAKIIFDYACGEEQHRNRLSRTINNILNAGPHKIADMINEEYYDIASLTMSMLATKREFITTFTNFYNIIRQSEIKIQ